VLKSLYPCLAFAAAALVAPQAAAQSSSTGTSSQVPSPSVITWYAGAATGVAAADAVGGLFYVEAGMRTWRNVDVSGELGWYQNAAPSGRERVAAPLAAFLSQTQGQDVSVKVTMPTTYAMVNGRWVFEGQRRLGPVPFGRFRPYALVGLGAARVSVHSKFRMAGTDITGSLPQFGVTLGGDLAGHSSHPAVSGGAGVIAPYGKWYGDVGYRLTHIALDRGSANVNRLTVTVGRRF
jgi:outer membrane protein with beta-barrel domain